MDKKTKIIDIFRKPKSTKNEVIQYSDLLNEFIEPYEQDFAHDYSQEDIFFFAMDAWNFGNLSLLVPKKEMRSMLFSSKLESFEKKIMTKLIAVKAEKFEKFDRFIADFKLEEEDNGFYLSVVTVEAEQFLMDMMHEGEDMPTALKADYEDGFINRNAVIIKPKQIFLDWFKSIYPNSPMDEIKETNIYLLDDDNMEIEPWLKKKYDVLFRYELEDCHLNKKEWPQKRSYKMFNQWFDVQFSSLIYDMEKKPIHKG